MLEVPQTIKVRSGWEMDLNKIRHFGLSLRSLASMWGLGGSCPLAQGLELYPHGGLRTSDVLNDCHKVPIIGLSNLFKLFCALSNHVLSSKDLGSKCIRTSMCNVGKP